MQWHSQRRDGDILNWWRLFLLKMLANLTPDIGNSQEGKFRSSQDAAFQLLFPIAQLWS